MRTGTWFRSSHSTASGECVEVRFDGRTTRVRDSKNRRPTISLASGWRAFLSGVRGGAFETWRTPRPPVTP
ncbi:DUF397 domain-containing protein [Saccharothrix longispora]|uniref:DUF397 domain-containing protein n=1 Tax=Saccharothrix longispora TaxID=33920 RepID=A0ABU1Q0N2_9PSEU|nr:DUF397 domain-containing protein [Saccharothrix longispora]MDR6596457.1 hypothetical protein [Saccharothrix longispora]